MGRLANAWNITTGTLKPQKQGACGLYSFWHASLLLSAVSSDKRPIIYPRKGEGGSGESLRHYAKHTLKSGQGEILSCAEMENVIAKFGYNFESHIGEAGREAFVTAALQADRPILVPYMMGNSGPIASFPPNSTGGSDYGPHWSLIFHETPDRYFYAEPNVPNTPTKQLKTVLLKSNSFVDDYKYDRFWSKAAHNPKLPYEYQSGIGSLGNVHTPAAKYDIGEKSRQKLANVLIAVY